MDVPMKNTQGASAATKITREMTCEAAAMRIIMVSLNPKHLVQSGTPRSIAGVRKILND